MKKNARVGCRGHDATHMVPVSFRVLSDGLVHQIQRQYASGFYTQKELAARHSISGSLISKVCRSSADNVDAAMRGIRSRLRKKRAV